MQVRDRFAAVGAVVDDKTVAVREVLLPGDRRRREQEVPENVLVFAGGLTDARNEFFRNDQDVGRGLRIDVLQSDAVIVFVDLLRRDFAVDDLLENRFFSHVGLEVENSDGSPGRGQSCRQVVDESAAVLRRKPTARTLGTMEIEAADREDGARVATQGAEGFAHSGVLPERRFRRIPEVNDPEACILLGVREALGGAVEKGVERGRGFGESRDGEVDSGHDFAEGGGVASYLRVQDGLQEV